MTTNKHGKSRLMIFLLACTSYGGELLIETNAIYSPAYRPMTEDHWFSGVAQYGRTVEFPVRMTNQGMTEIRVTVCGVGASSANPDHLAQVFVNRRFAGQLAFDGQINAQVWVTGAAPVYVIGVREGYKQPQPSGLYVDRITLSQGGVETTTTPWVVTTVKPELHGKPLLCIVQDNINPQFFVEYRGNCDVVTVKQVYDWYGMGAEGVKRCVDEARSNGMEALVLIGDYHYRGGGAPSRLVPHQFIYTASDSWYARNGGAPEFPVGRIPVSSTEGLNAYVEKVKAYESGVRTKAVQVVVDNNEPTIRFQPDTTMRIVNPLKAKGYAVSLWQIPNSGMRERINNAVNSGRDWLIYVGHGTPRQWANENVYNYGDVIKLRNTKAPIVASFSCDVGYFHGDQECMAEAWIESRYGAVAVFASSAPSLHTLSMIVADGMMAEGTVGERWVAGLRRLYEFNPNLRGSELEAWTLLGDPMVK